MVTVCCSLYTECNDIVKWHCINLFLYLYRDNTMVNNQPSLSQLLEVPHSQRCTVSGSFLGPPALDLFAVFDWLWWIWIMTVDYSIALCVKIWSALSLLYTFSDIWRIYKFLLSSRRLSDAVPNCPGHLLLTLLKCRSTVAATRSSGVACRLRQIFGHYMQQYSVQNWKVRITLQSGKGSLYWSYRSKTPQ